MVFLVFCTQIDPITPKDSIQENLNAF